MSSHHSIKFFLTHYEQVANALERKSVKEQIRQLQRQADALKWDDYRRKRAVINAATRYIYWTEAFFYIVTFLTIIAAVGFTLRNI